VQYYLVTRQKMLRVLTKSVLFNLDALESKLITKKIVILVFDLLQWTLLRRKAIHANLNAQERGFQFMIIIF
jgi:hypothetical protein